MHKGLSNAQATLDERKPSDTIQSNVEPETVASSENCTVSKRATTRRCRNAGARNAVGPRTIEAEGDPGDLIRTRSSQLCGRRRDGRNVRRGREPVDGRGAIRAVRSEPVVLDRTGPGGGACGPKDLGRRAF